MATGGSAFLCHASAATLLGSDEDATGVVNVGVVGRDRPRVAGIQGHRYASVPPTIRVGRLPVTSSEQTFLDLASTWPLVRLVTAGDQFVAQRWTTPERLVTTAAQASGRGARLARDAAALVRTGVESRMETPSRLLLVLAGLPEPVVNHPVTDGAGRSRRGPRLSRGEARDRLRRSAPHRARGSVALRPAPPRGRRSVGVALPRADLARHLRHARPDHRPRRDRDALPRRPCHASCRLAAALRRPRTGRPMYVDNSSPLEGLAVVLGAPNCPENVPRARRVDWTNARLSTLRTFHDGLGGPKVAQQNRTTVTLRPAGHRRQPGAAGGPSASG